MSDSKASPRSELDAELSRLSLIQAQELVAYLKEKYGIETAAGGAVMMARPGAFCEPEPEFTVVLKTVGKNKLQVIKAIRAARSDLSPTEAKALALKAPKPLLKNLSKRDADRWKTEFEAAGATVEICEDHETDACTPSQSGEPPMRESCAGESCDASGASEIANVTQFRPSASRTNDAPLRVSDRAFEGDLPSLLGQARGKWAAYIRDTRVGIYESKDAAVTAALGRGASIDEVYVRCILPSRALSVEF